MAGFNFSQKPAYQKKNLPLSWALIWIFLSTCLVSGSATFAWLYYLHLNDTQKQDQQYTIKVIVQTGPQKEALRTTYLEELLGLSVDRPTNLYALDTEEAEQRLMSSPVIKEAKVRRIPPQTLFIDYIVRQPLAILIDYTNTAIDEEGMLFPVLPFFTPKNLPEVYLGLPPLAQLATGKEEIPWSEPLQSREAELALTLIQTLTSPQYRDHFPLKRIDTSNAYAESFGQREVVIILENPERILRLNTQEYLQALGNYLKLSETLPQEEVIVDLRIPRLAYISKAKK